MNTTESQSSSALSPSEIIPLEGSKSFNFGAGLWNSQEWLEVKSSRWEYIGHWVQEADHIQNAVPPASDPGEYCNELAPQTFTSMIWNRPLKQSFVVSSTMEFDHLMAPLIVLAEPVGHDKNGYPEYRQHWEVVIYNEGINVWHHEFNGKQTWHLAASVKSPLQAKEKYDLVVEVRHRKGLGAELVITCGGIKFSYIDHDFPETIYAGITGCEGINRFYDFKVSPLK